VTLEQQNGATDPWGDGVIPPTLISLAFPTPSCFQRGSGVLSQKIKKFYAIVVDSGILTYFEARFSN